MTPGDSVDKKEPKCKYCYDKHYYSVIVGIHGAKDFGNDGFDLFPSIHYIACSKCNRSNRRGLTGIQKNLYSN